MKVRIFWLTLSVVTFITTTALGDDLYSGMSEDDNDSAAAGAEPDAAAEPADDSQRLQLSLDESIQLALQNNLDVEVQRFTPLIAGEQETEAWGAYDPEFFGEFGYSDSELPSSFALDLQTLNKTDSYDGFGGIRGLLPYIGSEYSFQFNGERTRSIEAFGKVGFRELVRLPGYVQDMHGKNHDYILMGMNLVPAYELLGAGD